MKFYPDTLTEKELTQLEKNIAEMYGQASKEMGETANRYFNKLTDRYNKELEAFKEGKYTKEEFIAWYQTQVQRGDGYKTMANKLASRATEADIVAQALINDATPSIFSLNANYEAYRITQAYNNIDFQLYDEQTVRRLMAQQNHIEFKTVSVNPIRDYEWNRKEIHKALTAGILQGKSPEHLAQSYLKVMKRDEVSARRNARTSFTSAQNAGRLETYYRADKMGIELKKEWISTHDSRTRDSHGDLDGERVDYDKEFSNGLMYPADKDGAPAEVYNCRCTMRAILPDINDEKRKTYKDWVKEQEKKQGNTDNKEKNKKIASNNIKQIAQNKPKVVTRADAKDLGLNSIGLTRIDDSTNVLDEKLFTENMVQLEKLENRFNAIKNSTTVELIAKNSGNAEAYVSNRTSTPNRQTLSLCPLHYKKYSEMENKIKNEIVKNWAMPCKEENYAVYNITHEYGHIIQNVLITEQYKKNGWTDQNSIKFYDFSKKTKKARNKWYNDNVKIIEDNCYTEILDIAKANNANFVLSDNISDYGKSCKSEFFAEVFANSQLGEPNELGKAMNEWLIKKGL